MRILLLFIFVTGLSNCSPRLAPDAGWGRQQWKVVEMRGVPVQQSGGRRDAHIIFNVAEKTFGGNGGCNRLSGNYSLDRNDINFANIVTTKMSCDDIEFENVFLNELSGVDRYEINGDELRLKHKRETVLVLRSR